MPPVGLRGKKTSWVRGSCLCSLPASPLPSDVFPSQMEGVKLIVNKVLSSHFQAGAPTSLASPYYSSLPTPVPFSPSFCSPGLARLCGTNEDMGFSLCALPRVWDLLLFVCHVLEYLGFSCEWGEDAGWLRDENGAGRVSPHRLFFPQVAHTVHMSALGLPGYHLHAAYAGDWQLSPTEVRTLHTWESSLNIHLGPRP